jgi:hypothetical protein
LLVICTTRNSYSVAKSSLLRKKEVVRVLDDVLGDRLRALLRVEDPVVDDVARRALGDPGGRVADLVQPGHDGLAVQFGPNDADVALALEQQARTAMVVRVVLPHAWPGPAAAERVRRTLCVVGKAEHAAGVAQRLDVLRRLVERAGGVGHVAEVTRAGDQALVLGRVAHPPVRTYAQIPLWEDALARDLGARVVGEQPLGPLNVCCGSSLRRAPVGVVSDVVGSIGEMVPRGPAETASADVSGLALRDDSRHKSPLRGGGAGWRSWSSMGLSWW